jgi:hypothetical protein
MRGHGSEPMTRPRVQPVRRGAWAHATRMPIGRRRLSPCGCLSILLRMTCRHWGWWVESNPLGVGGWIQTRRAGPCEQVVRNCMGGWLTQLFRSRPTHQARPPSSVMDWAPRKLGVNRYAAVGSAGNLYTNSSAPIPTEPVVVAVYSPVGKSVIGVWLVEWREHCSSALNPWPMMSSISDGQSHCNTIRCGVPSASTSQRADATLSHSRCRVVLLHCRSPASEKGQVLAVL